jgi:prepilin-type N-terminal cleavage/methylation domain-containing protein/prepilin-type processing-associated H-X9-DG protein
LDSVTPDNPASATFNMVRPATTGRNSKRQDGRSVSAFTLIELLVVITVVGIMAALLLPALAKSKEQARSSSCRNNMKQLALAFLMYSEDNEDTFPWPGGHPGRAVNASASYGADWCASPDFTRLPMSPSSANLPGFGHNAESGSIFPYVTSQPRRQYDPSFKEPTPVYRCPSTGRLGESLRVNYSANGWMDPNKPFGTGVVGSRGVVTSAVSDASRKVLLVNETPETMLTPAFQPQSPSRKVVLHLGRANVAFMDGHMQSVPAKDFAQWRGVRDIGIYFNAGK